LNAIKAADSKMNGKKIVVEGRDKGLVIFGIILLTIGSVASYYQWTQYETHVLDIPHIVYPYNNVGIILLVAGIIFMALGFLYSPLKTPPPTSSSLPQPSST